MNYTLLYLRRIDNYKVIIYRKIQVGSFKTQVDLSSNRQKPIVAIRVPQQIEQIRCNYPSDWHTTQALCTEHRTWGLKRDLITEIQRACWL